MPDFPNRTGGFFDPDNLVKSVIAIPLLRQIAENPDASRAVIVDVNLRYARGRDEARREIVELIRSAAGDEPELNRVNESKTAASSQYVYARLQGKVISKLVELDQSQDARAIHHIWPDFPIQAHMWKSEATVKADACRRAFATMGQGIVWAVLDSGIDGGHPHFGTHRNLENLPAPLCHIDFTQDPPVSLDLPTDDYGHGTHVAGILAGECENPIGVLQERDAHGHIAYTSTELPRVSGIAPECKLLSYKVITGEQDDPVSNVMAALERIQQLNGHGRDILIHGVNISLGYDFEPEWFACGSSPICVEVDRLVRCGVSVVISAGNTGRGFTLSINDPGNAALAITVGSTHRDMPHVYGVSYFSSKGPTGDGRQKPDLLAPGEKILSCGAGPELAECKRKAGLGDAPGAYYIERSGTSMSASHVSGIIAGLLSVRTEYIGLPEEIKRLLVKTATDLGRERGFQGSGLVDMMRAIQAI